jgi:predicted MPP superfamily phosphohydrolase
MIIIMILAIAASVYVLFILPTQWLKVEHIHVPSALDIKILQISDLHVEKLRISPQKLKRIIEHEMPDYIFLTGDFTQKESYLTKVGRYAEAISSPGIPVFAVLGNHDHRLNRTALNGLVRILELAGIQVLNNRSFPLNGFQIVGIDDFGSKKSRIDDAFKDVDPSKPTLVLTHNPNVILHLKYEFTYLMAGHFHGKQFNIPYLFQFINKGKLAASGIYKGLHTGKYGTFYISKGIGQAGLNARLFIRSEVTLHYL